jgi:hypothetical protein
LSVSDHSFGHRRILGWRVCHSRRELGKFSEIDKVVKVTICGVYLLTIGQLGGDGVTHPSRSPPPKQFGNGRSPRHENTIVFSRGSLSNGEPGGGFPIAVTTCTSPLWAPG